MRRDLHVLLSLLAGVPACFADDNRQLTTDAPTTDGGSGSTDATTGEPATTGGSSSTGAADPPQVLIVPLVDSENDALQNPGGAVLVDYGWVTLGSSDHWGGMRFAVPDLPQGATIVAAEFLVYVDDDNGVFDSPRVEIYGELAPNPPVFTATTDDIGGRPRTNASVLWSADDIGAGLQKSPSIVSVIQELVDQPDWAPNQHIVLILDATAQTGPNASFEYRQFDLGPTFAPTLGIQYYP